MEILFNQCKDKIEQVRTLALTCIVHIAQEYYHILEHFMQTLFDITYLIIQKDEEEPAMQAVEFWSTICEEEMYLDSGDAGEDKKSNKYIAGAMEYLVPLITKTLTKQEDEPNDDDWNLPMAAGTCLSLMATTVSDGIVPHVLPFVESNINHQDWKHREAATMAFGAILEGSKQVLLPHITTGLPVFMHNMQDSSQYVKDTTAWTIGRICEFHPEAIQNHLNNLIHVLGTALSEPPRVSANVSYALHNLAQAFDDSEKETGALSSFFAPLLSKLMETADRKDSQESHLRSAAYEAVNVLIQTGAKDTLHFTIQAYPVFINRLSATFELQILSNDDKENQSELQGLLCGVLQVLTNKVGPEIKTDKMDQRMMELFLKVLQSPSTATHEEALMAVGAVANVLEKDFEMYFTAFIPSLMKSLENYQEYSVCSAAVGIVGDIARALLAGTILPLMLSSSIDYYNNFLIFFF